MARLIDEIRENGKLAAPWWVTKPRLWRKHTVGILDILATEEPEVFEIDEVAQAYFSGNDQEYWDLGRDFPSLEPPRELVWFEYRLPRVIRSRVCGDTDLASLVEGRVGLLMIGSKREDVVGEGIPPEVEWVLTFELFLDYGGGNIQGSHGAIHIAVDGSGRVVDRPWLQTFARREGEVGIVELITFTHPVLLAFAGVRARAVSAGAVR
jgi:hypothetical protein